MLRFVMRHGLVRLIGGRVVPVLMVWDAAMLANRARRIPAVDRGLRRGAGAALRGVGAARRGLGTVIPAPDWRRGPRPSRQPDRPLDAEPTARAERPPSPDVEFARRTGAEPAPGADREPAAPSDEV